MNDLISRRAAIDALDGEIKIIGRTNAEAVKGYVRLVKDRLERLPSAEPQITRCKDCEYWHGEGKYCDYDMSGLAEDFCSWARRRDDEDD